MSRHKKYLRGKSRSYSKRRVNTREVRQRFLIVCQGEKTEPNYFEKFRVSGLVVDVKGVGCDSLTLVRKALALMGNDDYDQIWCVFDRDNFPVEQINASIELARNEDIQIAFSNEAFELWYLLHFIYLDAGITRQDYCKRLERYLGYKYEKNSQEMYDKLLELQPAAIRNAERLLSQYQPSRPVQDNPSTTVHLLVKQLNRYSRP